jgi:hypothetical protein
VGLAVLLGVGIGAGAVALTGERGEPGTDAARVEELADPAGLPPEHRAHATAFLEAWQRFRTGTFVVGLRLERTKPGDESPLVSDGILVQQPPRRIVRAFGNESAMFADGAQTCELGTNDSSVCSPAPEAASYDVQVAEELSILSQYFSGETPLYRVDASSKACFQLHLYRAMPLPPYGDLAQFCFDTPSGAMTLFEMKTAGGNERTTSLYISTTVTDADFAR